MSFDYWDKRDLEAMEKRIVDAQEKAVRQLQQAGDRSQAETVEAFNRVARSLEALVEEVKGLRADLNPTLDKPSKLPAPAKTVGP